METLAKQAVQIINSFKENEVIMEFVTNEALEKTASDIREKTNSGTTAKAVELLRITNSKVDQRVKNYINAGLYGVYLHSISA